MKYLALLLLFSTSAQAETWNNLLNFLHRSPRQECASCTVSVNGAENAAPNSVSSADLCTNPTAAVCAQFQHSTVDAVQAEFRKAVATVPEGDAFDLQYQKITSLQAPLPANASTQFRRGNLFALMAEEKKQMTLIAQLEKNVLTKFNKTPADLSAFFELVRNSLINHVMNSPEFNRTSNENQIVPSGEDIARQLRSVKLETAGSIAAEDIPQSDADVTTAINKREGYYRSCGTDGLRANAFYDPGSNTLKICPGFLVMTLNDSGGKIETLSMVLGHELGHSIDSFRRIAPPNLAALKEEFPSATTDISLRTCYANFLKCVDEKYATQNVEHFGTLSKVIDQLGNRGLPALQTELTRLQAQDPVDMDEVARVKRALLSGNALLSKYQDLKQQYLNQNQDPDKIVNVQQQELTADYNSIFALNDRLNSVPEGERAAIASQSYRLFCGTAASARIRAMEWGDLNDAQHPPDQFRIEMTFRNPETRRLLGCNPLETARPWCDVH